ncbi:MAG: hypothetical protein LBS55_12085 [Prevotellaceae bacterium]|jgi:hypothetical protein|nr:hypothetical protein [Prevotellaceae bacterium]
MKRLLTDIQNRLAAATHADNSALFAYVDLDWGQTDFYEGMPPVKFPCALIDVQNAAYSNEGNLVQIGIVVVQIRIVDLILSRTSAGAPAEQREKAARILDLLQETYRLLHGFSGNHYGQLIRQTTARVRRRDGLHEYTMTFETALTDETARPQRTTISITPKINI